MKIFQSIRKAMRLWPCSRRRDILTERPVLQADEELVAPKPAAPAPRGRFVRGRLQGAAPGRGHYRLYIPPEANTRPLPLVVMLHGCKQSASDFAAGTGMNALAGNEARQKADTQPGGHQVHDKVDLT